MPAVYTIENMPAVYTIENMPAVYTIENMPAVYTIENMPAVYTIENMPAVYTIENMPANPKVWNAHILAAWGERAGDFCLPTQACFLTDCKKQFCPLPCFLIWQ